MVVSVPLIFGAVRSRVRAHGFAIVPGVLSAVEVAEVKRELAAIIAERRPLPDQSDVRIADLSPTQRAGVTRAAAGDAYYILGDLAAASLKLARLIAGPRIVALAKAALGVGAVRHHYANITSKPARIGPRLGWHRDFPNRYIAPHASTFCRVMIALDGMDRANGVTRFVVGSHRLSDAAARRRDRIRKRVTRAMRVVDAVCPAGAAVVFHAKVLHGGKVNRSPRPRDNLVIQWGRAGVTQFATTNLERFTLALPGEMRMPGSG